MSVSRQIPLDLAHRTAFGDADFLVAPSNAEAVAWLDRWPEWPATALIVHGPPGCGKTHLARMFMARSGARPLDAETLAAEAPQAIARAADWVVEDADRLVPGFDEPLFHLYNALAESNRRLLLTATRPPARWSIGLADLSSRLKGALLSGIRPPDDALLSALLVKLFADRQLKVDKTALSFMLARMERSFDGARRLVAAIDRAALAERRAVTVPFVGRVMERTTERP